MFSTFTRWRNNRIINRSNILPHQWLLSIEHLPILQPLTQREKEKLIELSTLFLHYKTIEGAKGLSITSDMKRLIALQACLPILNLGLDWYDDWYAVIVYPSAFVPHRTLIDDNGIQHETRTALSGESWHKGPVILAWDETRDAGLIDGNNLVIHEFAHKLDIQSGHSNGFPPLHSDMNMKNWTQIMRNAYDNLLLQLHNGSSTYINAYAAQSPAEFFAVISELFFERPDLLNQHDPAIYEVLKQFYRQDTLHRQAAIKNS